MSTVDIETRIGKENADNAPAPLSQDNIEASKTEEPVIVSNIDILPLESSEDLEQLKNFNVKEAWEQLYNLPGYTVLMLSPHITKKVGCEVGVNVSQEFPWRQIKFRHMVRCVFEELEGGTELERQFRDYEADDMVLIGYCPVLTENEIDLDETDPFITFNNHYSNRKASQIIQNIQIYEKWITKNKIEKKCGEWRSLGSHREVFATMEIPKDEIVNIELQSMFPTRLSNSKLSYRRTSDVRDGYVELIPGEKKYDNIYKKRVHMAIQSSPKLLGLQQQTDSTFPMNAWSEYFYEFKGDGDDGLDVTSEEEEERKPGPKVEKPPPPPYETSTQVQALMDSLQFNQIDLSRNDYKDITIVEVAQYSNPYLGEVLCFADISKSLNRFVCGVDWYPTISGLLTTSYTYSTLGTSEDLNESKDVVAQIIYSRHPILLWSFADSLHPKLEFDSPQQITCLSYCPYAPTILIGGAINGQVLLWDLQDRVINLDYEESLSAAQTRYRAAMSSFLDWSKYIDELHTVYPSIVSPLETSQTGAITAIKWLPRNYTISTDGKIRLTTKSASRFFLTSSIDGSCAIWNLDMQLDKKQRKKAKAKPPKQLCASESVFKVLDRIFKPIFLITVSDPLSCTICETAKFTYVPYSINKSHSNLMNKFPIQVKLDTQQQPIPSTGEDQSYRNPLISSTLFGTLIKYYWSGIEYESGLPVNSESVSTKETFANVHDGPIIGLESNPFFKEYFASIGRYVLAIWRTDFLDTPILWRKRPCELTGLKWSEERPAVLYLTRIDGSFEAWDILAQDNDACLSDVLGGGILTALTEHRPNLPKKFVGIGDFNSSFRIIELPASFQNRGRTEIEDLKKFFDNEVERKKSLKKWDESWKERNADILEAKKFARIKSLEELELLKKKAAEEAEAKVKQEELEERRARKAEAKGKIVFDLPEKLERKWDEQNLKRLLEVLMLRKMVDAVKLEKQTAIEKKRLAYEKSKKTALKKNSKKIDEDVAAIRARILPVIVEEAKRSDMIMDSVEEIIQNSKSYDEIELEMKEYMEQPKNFIDLTFNEFFLRGRRRRKIINKALGSNLDRTRYYHEMKEMDNFEDINVGYVPPEVSSQVIELVDQIPEKDITIEQFSSQL